MIRLNPRALTLAVVLVLGIFISEIQAQYPVTSVPSTQPGAAGNDALRAQCDALLVQARQALSENRLQDARVKLEQAEALNVQYPVYHPGDRPALVRRDLERASVKGTSSRNVGVENVTTRPAGLNPQAMAAEYLKKGREALIAGNLTEASHWATQAGTYAVTYGPNDDTPQRLMADIQARSMSGTSSGMQVATPSPAVGATAATGVAPMSKQALGTRNRLIINARVALSEGDINRAADLANKAGAMNVPYNPTDDTHDAVLRHIQAYQDIKQRCDREGLTQQNRRELARNFLMQSQTLLGWMQLDKAAAMATAAGKLGVQFNEFEVQPSSLLARIEKTRAQQLGRSTAPVQNTPINQMQNLLAQARTEMRQGNMPRAAELTRQAQALNIPEVSLAANMDRPSAVMRELAAAGYNIAPTMPGMTAGINTSPAPLGINSPAVGGVTQVSSQNSGPSLATVAAYTPSLDGTQNIRVSGTQLPQGTSPGYTLLKQAEIALQQNNLAEAKQLLVQAEGHFSELDEASQKRLRDVLITVNSAGNGMTPAISANTSLDPVQTALHGQLATEMENISRKAADLRTTDPRGAVKMLEDMRSKIEKSELKSPRRDMLIRSITEKIDELNAYIAANRTQIEMQTRNVENWNAAVQDQENIHVRQQQLAQMVTEFNKLLEERRFAEAEVVGKKAKEMYPKEAVAIQLDYQGRFLNRMKLNNDIRQKKEDSINRAFLDVDMASAPVTEDFSFNRTKAEWDDLKNKRNKYSETQSRLNERELEIKKKLRTPVQCNFTDQPLSVVLDALSTMTGVSIVPDPSGLADQGVSASDLVTLAPRSDVTLESALKLILSPLHMTYVIRNEVLLITSQNMKDTDIYPVAYPVADLVIPIPNFSQTRNSGLEGALRRGMATSNMSMGGAGWQGAMAAPTIAMGNRGNAAMNSEMLGQTNVPVGGAGTGVSGGGLSSDGGMSGGAEVADFDSLIDLITTTVEPGTWEQNGGTGTIAKFPVNLSLVVRQTQEIHEQVADLLEQLRRMQDLQVTIEVRFITLTEDFYERIGVDFNARIRTDNIGSFINAGDDQWINTRNTTTGNTAYGLQNPTPSDILFNQGSFATAIPSFGGYDAATTVGGQLGFAILSDVEAYLFMEAAQSDSRSNVLQAPKVTLFNGQQAVVKDTSEQPFVTSVTPYVGDFAAALQPVIVVLSEGTFMTVQAVVSPDRRFVRLTVVPFFSKITDVKEFTFTGSTSSTEDTSTKGDTETDKKDSETSSNKSSNRTGTTVQLPTFAYVTVTTTVSVPDGGTVVLGGIKRLSEGRDEQGVPILSKMPFINRLFKNVGIGRETSTLMMVVTPRIIIQEEEEANLGVTP